MTHPEVLRACLAYHDHAITLKRFAAVVRHAYGTSVWWQGRFLQLMMLCGGA